MSQSDSATAQRILDAAQEPVAAIVGLGYAILALEGEVRQIRSDLQELMTNDREPALRIVRYSP